MCIQVQIKPDFGINCPSDKTSKEDLDLCVWCRWAGLSAATGGVGARGGGVGDRAGLIKSYSPTSRTSDFWGRTSKNLPFSSPRTTGFFQSTCPKLLSLRCHKVLFPVNSYYLLPVNPDVWSPSWLFCRGKAWHLFLKDFTHFCATSFYPFVLLLILLLKGFKNFLMLVPSTNDKND